MFTTWKVKRAHKQEVKKFRKTQYQIYIKFDDNDNITLTYDIEAQRDEAWDALRKACGLLTEEEKAAQAAKAEKIADNIAKDTQKYAKVSPAELGSFISNR